jgi:dTDP-4-amino-4,6-dideoxygalactose transaminase
MTERTKAIMPVHFGGNPLDVDGFAALAEESGVWIVEDAAHAIGAVADGRRVGSPAGQRCVACFSFYPNKNLATAEGGAITTSDPRLAASLRDLRLHGLAGDAWDRYRSREYRPSLAHAAGFKYNWTDLQAAVALAQLERLEGFLATREFLASVYDEELRGVDGVSIVRRPEASLAARHALHLYQVVIERPPPARDDVLRRLRAAGIGAAVHYVSLARHPYYADRYPAEQFPVSEWASDQLLTLPLHVHMGEADVRRVVDALRAAV